MGSLNRATSKQGFTLLELSIVIAIIGLIIGGITAGVSLIKSAELNSVISEYGKYKSAVETFKIKYQSLPGDMPDASDFWTSCINSLFGGNLNPCNGNGDGKLSTTTSLNEPLRVWQHLSLSDTIEGSYTGYVPRWMGESLPKSTMDGMGWMFTEIGNPSAVVSGCLSSDAQNKLYGHSSGFALTLGAIDYLSGNDTYGYCLSEGMLTVDSAYFIDKKTDDGIADSGKTLGVNGSDDTTGCAGAWSDSVSNGNYNLSDKSDNCRLVFLLD